MGQWDQIECATIATQTERPAYDFVKLLESKKLPDGKFANRDDELRLQKIDFIIHPRRTIPDLVRSWNAVPARGGFSGKAAANRREVNLGAHLHFTETTKLFEPTEEGAARGPGKRLAQHRLSYSGRLTDEHDLVQDGTAGNGWRQHPRTTPTLEQMRDMLIQQLLPAR
jgi:hypothetical protein